MTECMTFTGTIKTGTLANGGGYGYVPRAIFGSLTAVEAVTIRNAV